MFKFLLPSRSKTNSGKTYHCSNNTLKRTYRIYRFNPEDNLNPSIDTFEVPTHNGQTIMSVLNTIREIHPSIAFRKSCSEGACGTCGVNINGTNTLSCITKVSDIKGNIEIYPLTGSRVIKDLVCDMSQFFDQYKKMKPWIMDNSHKDGKQETIQTQEDRKKLDGSYECVMCGCCSTACPSYWWNSGKFIGPATLLQVYRWVMDSRDKSAKTRLQSLSDDGSIYNCHSIFNCTKTCPKNLNPADKIASLKRKLVLSTRKSTKET